MRGSSASAEVRAVILDEKGNPSNIPKNAVRVTDPQEQVSILVSQVTHLSLRNDELQEELRVLRTLQAAHHREDDLSCRRCYRLNRILVGLREKIAELEEKLVNQDVAQNDRWGGDDGKKTSSGITKKKKKKKKNKKKNSANPAQGNGDQSAAVEGPSARCQHGRAALIKNPVAKAGGPFVEENQVLSNRVEELSKTSAHLSHEVLDLKDTVSELKKKWVSAKREVEAGHVRVEEFKKIVDAFSTKKQRTIKFEGEAKAKAGLENTILALKHKIDKYKKTSQSDSRNSKALSATQLKEIQTLEDTCSDLRRQLSLAGTRLVESQNKVAEQTGRLSRNNSHLFVQAQRFEPLVEVYCNLEQRHLQLQQRTDELEQQDVQSQQRIAELEQQHVQLQQPVVDLSLLSQGGGNHGGQFAPFQWADWSVFCASSQQWTRCQYYHQLLVPSEQSFSNNNQQPSNR